MENRIKKAVALLQSVAIGLEPTHKALEYIAGLLGGDGAVLVNWNGLANGSQPSHVFNRSPALLSDYIASFADRDIQVKALVDKWGASPPSVFLDDEVLPRRVLLQSEIYNEYWKPLGVQYLAALQSREISRFGIGSMRILIFAGSTLKEGFGVHHKRILAALSPHFDSAALLFVGGQDQAYASLAAAFEHAADAVAIIDCSGRLCYKNAAFESLRSAFDPHAQRYWATPLESPTFQVMKAAFRSVLIETGASGLSARRCEFSLAAQPPKSTPRRFIGLVSTSLTAAGLKTRGREPLFMLVLRESAVVQNERVLALRRLHQLTPMETLVLRRFAEGKDLRTIAAEMAVTLHTARSHMKMLLSKTGCHRQTELVRLLETTPTGKIRLLI